MKHKNNNLKKEELDNVLSLIKHKIFVFSGKGGVGKSTIASNLAAGLAQRGYKTGILDIDIHGPSIPKLFNIEDVQLKIENNQIQPIEVLKNLKAISIGSLINSTETPIIWRGPRKVGVIKQFIKDVNWGKLDYLIVDSPPGTGDEPLTICQLIPDADGAVIVTTPQDLAIIDVKKAITFCREVDINIIGVIENMSGFKCPNCGTESHILKSNGGQKMAESMKVPFLGKIPIEMSIAQSGDDGIPYICNNESLKPSLEIFNKIIDKIDNTNQQTDNQLK